MKKKQVFLLSLIMMTLFVLCGCGAKQEMSISSSGDSVTVNDLALRPDGEAGYLYENGGLKLLIPLEYDALLITEMPQDDAQAQLFSVSEKASLEAARPGPLWRTVCIPRTKRSSVFAKTESGLPTAQTPI